MALLEDSPLGGGQGGVCPNKFRRGWGRGKRAERAVSEETCIWQEKTYTAKGRFRLGFRRVWRL